MDTHASRRRPDREDQRLKTALFRHGLIGHLASSQLNHGELTLELRKIARRQHRNAATGRMMKVGLSTLRRWLAAFRCNGIEALKPGLRSDHGRSRAIPEVWVRQAVGLRIAVPTRTTRVIVEILGRLPECPRINPATLDRVLRRLGKSRKQIEKSRERVRRWSARFVNELWQGDATDGVWLPDPRDPKGEKKKQTVLFAWIDDVSRLITHGEFFFDEKLPRMERTLKLAVLKRGRPHRCYTDNGNVYRAIQYKAALADLDIKAVHSRVYRPRGRGKIERFFKTVQEDFYPEVYAAGIRTLAELNEAFWAWVERIYHQRVHTETRKTPLEAYRDGLQHVRPADPVRTARAFLWRFTRKVTKNGFVSLMGNRYSLDTSWCHRTIELRCDPFDLSLLDVYQDGRPVARAQVKALHRGHFLELDPLQPVPASEPTSLNFLDILRREHRRALIAETGSMSFLEALEAPGRNSKEERA